MKVIITSFLLVCLTNLSFSQTIGEDVQETIPAFGFCIMPDNTTFLALQADYDGMYITERELIDLFETGRFSFSKDLVNWTYYSYWALNERSFEQPENYSFYQMTVDPTGTYIAISKERRSGWDTFVELYEKSTQIKVAEFDVSSKNENISYLNQVRFDETGKSLILGADDQGVYSYNIEAKELSVLYPPYKYLFYDYSYETDKPLFQEYIKDEEGEYFLDFDIFTIKEGLKTTISLPLPLHYTRILSPTETHKYYGKYYEQEYDTYIAPIDDYNYQIIYRSKNTFVFITREVPKE